MTDALLFGPVAPLSSDVATATLEFSREVTRKLAFAHGGSAKRCDPWSRIDSSMILSRYGLFSFLSTVNGIAAVS